MYTIKRDYQNQMELCFLFGWSSLYDTPIQGGRNRGTLGTLIDLIIGKISEIKERNRGKMGKSERLIGF